MYKDKDVPHSNVHFGKVSLDEKMKLPLSLL